MLEKLGAERITTAALARQLDVSEAALYRHFASKAQMFEGLIEFIEHSVFTLAQQIVNRDPLTPARQPRRRQQAVRVVACCNLARKPRHGARDGGRRPGAGARTPARRMNQFLNASNPPAPMLSGAALAHGSGTPRWTPRSVRACWWRSPSGACSVCALGLSPTPTDELQAWHAWCKRSHAWRGNPVALLQIGLAIAAVCAIPIRASQICSIAPVWAAGI